MTLSAIHDLVALLVTFVLAGWFLGLVIIPRKLDLAARCFVSLALAVPATILVGSPSLVFNRLGIPGILIPLLVLAVIAVVRVAPRRPSLDNIRSYICSPYRLAGMGVAAGAIAVWWAALFAPEVALHNANGLPIRRTTWYYWWLVEEVVAKGGLPSMIHEWGSTHPFPTEYAVTTIHTAVTYALSMGPDLAFMEHYRLMVLGITIIAFYALWRRWMPSWWAVVATALTMSGIHLEARFLTYWVESFGFMLVVWSAWLLDIAFERRSKLWAILAGIVSATAFLSHAEIWLLTIGFWGGVVAGRLIPWVARHRRNLIAELRSFTARHRESTIRASVVLVMLIGMGFLGGWLGGSMLTSSIARVADITTIIRSQGHQSARSFGQDPTWAWLNATFNPAYINSPPPDYCSQLFSDLFTRQRYARFLPPPPVSYVLAAPVLVVMSLALIRGEIKARRFTLTWIGYFVGVYFVVWLMCQVYHTYVPLRATFRLKSYDVVAIGGLFAGAAWFTATALRLLLVRYLKACRPSNLERMVLSVLLAAVLTVPLLYALTPINSKAYNPYSKTENTPLAEYRAYKWMGENLPQNSIVLANGYTTGAIGSISGLNGWMDGRAPYLESPEWLYSATRQLLQGRAYFIHPSDRALLPKPIDYVVVKLEGTQFTDALWWVNTSDLRNATFLKLLRTFKDNTGEVRVYKVEK